MQAIQLKFNDRIIKVEKPNVIKTLFRMGRGLLTSILFLTPLMFVTSANLYNEELAFGIFACAVLLTVGAFVGLFLYKGRNLFLDPAGFLNVLIFALLIIIPSVATSPGTSANTFGLIGARTISGLAAILFVMAFYFINLFNIGSRLKRNLPVVAVVSNISILFGLIINYTLWTPRDTSSLYLAGGLAFATIFANFLFALKVADFKVRVVNVMVFLVTAALLFRSVSPELLIILTFVLVLFFYVLVLRAIKRVGLKNFKAEFLNNKVLQLYVVSGVVSLVVLLFVLLSTKVEFNALKQLITYFSNFGDLDGQDFMQIIAGRGVLPSVKTSSTLFGIISSFGLLGLTGYLSIFFYLFRREAINGGKLKSALSLNSILNILVLVTIAVTSLFVPLGIYMSLIFLFVLTESDKVEPFLIRSEFQFFETKWKKIIRKVVVVAVLILMSIISINLLRLLGILV